MATTLLFVVNVDWFFVSHRLPVALAAKRAGYSVHIATTFTDPDLRSLLVSKGLFVHDIYIDRSGLSIISFLRLFFRIFYLCRLVKPALVHLVTIQPVLIGGLASRIAGVPRIVFAISGLGHVFTVSSIFSKIRLLCVKFLYRISLSFQNKAVIFQNSSDFKNLSEICFLSSLQSYILPGSGVDLRLFSFQPLPPGIPVVMMASRLLTSKGVYDFVSAASILRKRHVTARFVLVGVPDSSNPAAVPMSDLKSWHDSGLIEVLGFRSDLNYLLSLTHIFCLPSYYPEGLPKVLCEAAACGRAIVTTNEPGCRDAIVENSTGVLVPSRDPLSLANALEHLLSDPSLIRQYGVNARKYAESNYCVDVIASKHLEIYDSLVSDI